MGLFLGGKDCRVKLFFNVKAKNEWCFKIENVSLYLWVSYAVIFKIEEEVDIVYFFNSGGGEWSFVIPNICPKTYSISYKVQ